MTPPSPLPPVSASLPERGDHVEILDGDEFTREELVRSLDAMASVNRRFGGTRGLLRALREVAAEEAMPAGGTLTVLDLGTGSGALPRYLARELSADRVHMEWAGLDLSRTVLEVAREGEGADPVPPRLVRADARVLPFADGSFDVVISSLTLHHLSNADGIRLLSEASRVARRRVLVSDLERHPLHYAGARLLALTLWRRDRITRVDGPLSVLRSFTAEEMADLARRASLRSVRIRRTFPFRLLIDGVPA